MLSVSSFPLQPREGLEVCEPKHPEVVSSDVHQHMIPWTFTDWNNVRPWPFCALQWLGHTSIWPAQCSWYPTLSTSSSPKHYTRCTLYRLLPVGNTMLHTQSAEQNTIFLASHRSIDNHIPQSMFRIPKPHPDFISSRITVLGSL